MTKVSRWFRESLAWLTADRRRYGAIAVVAILAAATAGLWALIEARSEPELPLAAMVPQGALLTIESKDFAGLLQRWSGSTEKTAWLKSDDYSVFSQSRLFGRLGDAQLEFARAAGLPPDMSFLTEVAGRESVFAWYDIGSLEFLYITRMAPGSADKTRLAGMHGKFSARRVGGQTFYVRTSQQASPALNAPSIAEPEGEPAGQPRTVAFAIRGDWLLLATREDLMVGALGLMALGGKAPEPAMPAQPLPLSSEPWFADARAAAEKEPGALRMTLNLERIVQTPYFRTYWIQRNVTEMKQYRSAVADLYLEPDRFREERVLLAKSPRDNAEGGMELAKLTRLLPEHAGVFRAEAAPTPDEAVASLDEKLLRRGTGSYTDSRYAPAADVTVRGTGAASDLETRIDDLPLTPPMVGSELAELRQTLAVSGLNGMMTVSRTGEAREGIWIPFESAVVLSSAKDWDTAALQSALQEALGARLTASGLGFAWKPVEAKPGGYFELSEARPLEMAVRGRVCILADDPGLMEEMLVHISDTVDHASPDPSSATLIAGFNLPQERDALARWSRLIDRPGVQPRVQAGTEVNTEAGSGVGLSTAGSNASTNKPAFFSQNMLGLTGVFSALESERIVETREAALTRQTVTYAWRR